MKIKVTKKCKITTFILLKGGREKTCLLLFWPPTKSD